MGIIKIRLNFTSKINSLLFFFCYNEVDCKADGTALLWLYVKKLMKIILMWILNEGGWIEIAKRKKYDNIVA